MWVYADRVDAFTCLYDIVWSGEVLIVLLTLFFSLFSFYRPIHVRFIERVCPRVGTA